MFLFLSMSVFEQGVESVNNDILHGDRGMNTLCRLLCYLLFNGLQLLRCRSL